MRQLYSFLLYLLLPVFFSYTGFRGIRNHAYWRRVHERLGLGPVLDSAVIWLHAVSVGEVRASAPLVKALQQQYPAYRILLTCTTPTGSEQARLLFGDSVAHRYVPWDLPTAVSRFLNRTRPALAIIMETEIWPNLFHQCRSRNIPILMSNVRLSAKSFRGYQRITGFVSETLHKVSILGAQSRDDADRLLLLGAPAERLQVSGNIKFELELPASVREAADLLRGQWGRGRPLWLAASTHEGEEEQVLQAFAGLRAQLPDCLLVLVPRHPERFTAAIKLCERAGYTVARRSEQSGELAPAVDVLVGDTMGELQLFFAAADVAFVGGSLVATGGHNILEAAAVGTPSVVGPHMFNFREILALSLERKAVVQVQDVAELVSRTAELLARPNLRHDMGAAGRRLVEENRGALHNTLEQVRSLLKE